MPTHKIFRYAFLAFVACATLLLNAQSSSKTLLNNSTALYARLVRISHSSNSSINGHIVASVTAFPGGSTEESIYMSADGVSFSKIGAVTDADFNGGLCCGTLYELPRAVGSLPAGTLLWSGSVGQNSTTQAMQLKVYQSQDGGATWSYLSNIATGTKPGTTAGGLWEPQFTVATDGALVAVFSDETVSGHSQLLRQLRTYDGKTWQDSTNTVASTVQSDRPGMAVITQLPGGLYFMTYELCGPAACTVFYRTSSNGWNWGDATNMGTKLASTSGQYFEHAPTNAWAASAGNANGSILVTAQMMYEANGTLSAGNGSTIFVSHSADGSGPWTTMTAPIKVPGAYDNYCPNYSSPLLPATDGLTVLEFSSDYVGTTCVMYYGSGSIAGGTAASTVNVKPSSTNVTSLPMDVTISVTPGNGQTATPSGTITLSTGSWNSTATTLANGVATIQLPVGSLASASTILSATYSGDANYAAASGTATVTVAASALPGFQLNATPVTIKNGAATGNISTITVTPIQGFSGAVTLAASITSSPANATSLPGLSFGNTSSVTATGSAPVTAQLTISTVAASTGAVHALPHLRPITVPATAALCCLLGGLGTLRRRRHLMLPLLLVSLAGLPGCGGSSSSGSSTVTTPGTSTGNYVVTVTGTSGNTTATTTLNLTIN